MDYGIIKMDNAMVLGFIHQQLMVFHKGHLLQRRNDVSRC
jgi:hypothetical protein